MAFYFRFCPPLFDNPFSFFKCLRNTPDSLLPNSPGCVKWISYSNIATHFSKKAGSWYCGAESTKANDRNTSFVWNFDINNSIYIYIIVSCFDPQHRKVTSPNMTNMCMWVMMIAVEWLFPWRAVPVWRFFGFSGGFCLLLVRRRLFSKDAISSWIFLMFFLESSQYHL